MLGPHVENTNWLQRIVAKAVKWRRQQTNHLRFASLDQAEVERIARDLRISVTELVHLNAQDEGAAAPLHQRLALLKVDPQQLDVSVLRDMERCCSSCQSKTQCEHDLAGASPAPTPGYCPNQQTLNALTGAKCCL